MTSGTLKRARKEQSVGMVQRIYLTSVWTGNDALRLLRHRRQDVVLCDLSVGRYASNLLKEIRRLSESKLEK